MHVLSYANPLDRASWREFVWRYSSVGCLLVALLSCPCCLKWALDLCGGCDWRFVVAAAIAAQSTALALWLTVSLAMVFDDRWIISTISEVIMPVIPVILLLWGIFDIFAGAWWSLIYR